MNIRAVSAPLKEDQGDSKTKSQPTQRAVDRWVRGSFSSVFLALSFSRFDGESLPTYLPLTQAVRYNL